MALLSTAGATAMVSGLTGVITHMACHTATTGTTGTNENANTGSYARQAVSWAAGANTGALTFSTAGTVAVTHLGGWTSGTYAGGTFEAGYPLASSITAASITFAIGAITNVVS